MFLTSTLLRWLVGCIELEIFPVTFSIGRFINGRSCFLRLLLELWFSGSDVWLDQRVYSLLNLAFQYAMKQSQEDSTQVNTQSAVIVNEISSSLEYFSDSEAAPILPRPVSSFVSSSNPYSSLRSTDQHPCIATPFWPFYKRLFEYFISDGLNEPLFLSSLFPLCRMEFHSDYRVLIWSELGNTIQTIIAESDHRTPQIIPYHINDYLWPMEKNNQVLELYKQLVSGTEAKLVPDSSEPAFITIVCHHLIGSIEGDHFIKVNREILNHSDNRSERSQRFKRLVPALNESVLEFMLNYTTCIE